MARRTTTAVSRAAGHGLLCMALLWSWAAFATDGAEVTRRADSGVSEGLRRAGWFLLTLPGQRGARFEQGRDGAIEVSASDGVAFLYREVAGNMGTKRRLAWRWRVDLPVPPTDLAKAGQDDRSLAVHICFPDEPEGGSLWDALADFAIRTFAAPLSGKVLTYVWGGTQSRGIVLTNPHLDPDGKIIVLRTGGGATGEWREEEIDFVADFRAAFGYDPPAPAYLAISVDSDDTDSRSRGAVAGLVFGG